MTLIYDPFWSFRSLYSYLLTPGSSSWRTPLGWSAASRPPKLRFMALWDDKVPVRQVAPRLGISLSTVWMVRTRLRRRGMRAAGLSNRRAAQLNAGNAVRLAEAGPIVMNWRTGKVAEALHWMGTGQPSHPCEIRCSLLAKGIRYHYVMRLGSRNDAIWLERMARSRMPSRTVWRAHPC
jgi:hypothetical protein